MWWLYGLVRGYWFVVIQIRKLRSCLESRGVSNHVIYVMELWMWMCWNHVRFWAGGLVGLFTCLCEWDPRVWCSFVWTLQRGQLQSSMLNLCCVNLAFLLIVCEPQIRYLLFLLRCSWSHEVRLGAFSSSAWIYVRGRVVLRFTIRVTLGLFGFSNISLYVNSKPWDDISIKPDFIYCGFADKCLFNCCLNCK